MREGRSQKQVARKGQSSLPQIMGGQLAFMVNRFRLIVGETYTVVSLHDAFFHPLIARFKGNSGLG